MLSLLISSQHSLQGKCLGFVLCVSTWPHSIVAPAATAALDQNCSTHQQHHGPGLGAPRSCMTSDQRNPAARHSWHVHNPQQLPAALSSSHAAAAVSPMQTAATAAAMTQLEWPGARVRAAFNEFFQSKAHTFWASNAVVRVGWALPPTGTAARHAAGTAASGTGAEVFLPCMQQHSHHKAVQ